MPTSFNTFEPGVSGMGLWGLPVASYPGGAILFVSSVNGRDNRGRVKFPGNSAASTTGGVTQGPIGDPFFPLASITFALTLTQSGRGDTIFVLPGHVEALSANLTVSTNGTTIMGLPTGNSNLRPKIQPQVTTATVNVTGNGVVFGNIVFDGTFINNITAVTTVNAIGVYFYNCHWLLTTATIGAALAVSVVGGSGTLMEYCSCDATITTSGTTPTNFLLTSVAAHDHFTCRFGNFRGTFTGSVFADSSASPFTNLEFGPGNVVFQLSTTQADITLQATASTGNVFNNFLYIGKTGSPPGANAFITGTNTANLLQYNYVSFAKAAGPFSASTVIPPVTS